MSRFRKVDGGTWGDARFVSLTQDAKFLWLYLLTGPHVTSLPGLFTIGRSALAEAMGWTTRRLDERLDELTKTHPDHPHPMVKVDWKSRVMWLPNAAKHNRPTHPRTIDGWRGHVACIPECSLKHEAVANLRQYVVSWGREYLIKFDDFSGFDDVGQEASIDEPGSHQVTEPSSKQSYQPPLSTAPASSPALSEGVQGEVIDRDEPRRLPRGEWELHRALYVAAYERAVRRETGNVRWSMRKPEALWRVLFGCCINEERGDIEGWIDRHVRELVTFIRALSPKDSAYWPDFGPAEMQRWFNSPERGLKPAGARPADRDSKTRLRPATAPAEAIPPMTPEEAAALQAKFDEAFAQPAPRGPRPSAIDDPLSEDEIREAQERQRALAARRGAA